MPHLDDALSLARWLTGNRDDAEDVVQDACLRAHGALDTYAGGSARAWLLAIVRNTAFTWLAKNRRKTLVFTDDETHLDQIDPDATPEAALIAKTDALALNRAIADLPEQFREALVLRDLQGLSYKDIAETCGVPIGTVMSRLTRARNLLLTRLKEGNA
ncbi:sigma-70 family RNA polymerase sigma factor [Methylovirgula sp. 4M-Z18]|nr:sigma-70 family RNA polymerase sigma factor [Methylovirgula sp. 4M-Z18]